jgi:hypothetical protein
MIRGWANGCRCNVWGGQMCVDEMIRGGSSKKYYPGFEAALRPPKTCKY